MGEVHDLSKLVHVWEAAYGKTFDIQVAQTGDDLSAGSSDWATVASASRELSAGSMTETIQLDEGASGRFIRIYITEKCGVSSNVSLLLVFRVRSLAGNREGWIIACLFYPHVDRGSNDER
nr:hypothetical protein [Paenibacillus sp. NEAU-GSW1]